jgi:DNA-binding transcriptional regulator YiaG
MGKVEGIIKSEIIRLSKREVRKISTPLAKEVWLLKNILWKLTKTVSKLERFAAHQESELSKKKIPLEATAEEVKESRFSPRLIRSLRNHLGITQKELAILTGVTIGAVQKWESGQFKPSVRKKAVIVAIRKLGRREVRRIIESKGTQMVAKKGPQRRR